MSNSDDQIKAAMATMKAELDRKQDRDTELASGKLNIAYMLRRQEQEAELDRMRAELELGAARVAWLSDPSGAGYPQWRVVLDERERNLLAAAESYARNYSTAGLPGHNLLMLVAKLAKQLDRDDIKPVQEAKP